MSRAKEEEAVASFTLDLGIDNTTHETAVQSFGQGGALVSSVNTRLSKVRGVPTKAPGAVAVGDPDAPHSGSTACGGIIPCGHVSSSLVVRNRVYGAQRIAGTTLHSMGATLHAVGSATGPASYWPASVSRAGAVPGRGQTEQPAMCTLDGQLWFASVRTNASGLAVFVTVIGADGEMLAAPQPVTTEPSGAITSPPWIGLTAHGANGVRLWARFGTSDEVEIRTLTLVDGIVGAGGATTLYNPAGAGVNTYDVTAHGETYAWLVTLASSATTSIALTKVAVATNTVVTTTVAGVASTTSSRLAVKSEEMSAGDRVAVIVALTAGTSGLLLFNGATMANLFSIAGQMTYGDPACGFYREGATEYVVYGVSKTDGSTSALGTAAGTQIQFRDVDATGALEATKVIPWVRFVSRMAHHSPSATEIYPVFAAQTVWNDALQRFFTNPEYLSDAAVDVYRIDSTSYTTRIGRFGVDRAHIYSLTGLTSGAYNSQGIAADGDKLAIVYSETSGLYPDSLFPVRYVEMDFAARQPRHAIGSDGVSIVAGALPVEWDGVSFSEVAAPVRPKLAIASTGGSGSDPTAGDYIAMVHIAWTDDAGAKHRGFPSDVAEVTMSGADAWIFKVSTPYLFRDGVAQDRYEVELYISEVDDTVLWRKSASVSSYGDYVLELDNVSELVASATTPTIYTTGAPGEELPAQQPGAFHDVAIVVDRAWALNAERTNEWWYTKPKADGVAYEWSSELKVYTPSAAGDGVAVAESSGGALLMCSNGVWAVTGQGPDPTLVTGAFNPPEQISDIACTDRDSVIKTPAGVMFISNTRFAMIGPAGQRIFENIDATLAGTVFPVLLRASQEVVWFSSTGTHYVYNYGVDRWSTWDSTAVPAVAACSLDPVSGLVNIVRASDNAVMQIDPSEPSTAAQMSFATGDMVFGSPQDDNIVHKVLIHADREAAHGLTVTITPDYGQDSATTRTFTAAEILACTVGGQYTVSVDTSKTSMRAAKVAIAETGATGDAFRPTSVAIVYAKNPTTKQDAVRTPGRK
jgi:hypothetical protein